MCVNLLQNAERCPLPTHADEVRVELLAEQVCGWRLKVSDECLPRAPKTSADRWHTRSDRRLQKDGASGARKIDVGFEGIASAWRDPFCQLAVVLRSLVVLACDLSRGRGRRSAGLWRSGMIGRLGIVRSWAQFPRRLANEGLATKVPPPPSIHFPSPPLFSNAPSTGPVNSASWVMAE